MGHDRKSRGPGDHRELSQTETGVQEKPARAPLTGGTLHFLSESGNTNCHVVGTEQEAWAR